MLELLMSEWEDLLEDMEYEPVHHVLQAGITLLESTTAVQMTQMLILLPMVSLVISPFSF